MMVIIILFLVESLDVSVLISTFVPLFAMNIDKCDTVLFMSIISIFKSGCHKSTFHAFSHIEFMFAEHILFHKPVGNRLVMWLILRQPTSLSQHLFLVFNLG